MGLINFIDFACDLPFALQQTGVAPHIDQAALHLGRAHKMGAVHFGLQPQAGHQSAIDEKCVFHALDFASIYASSSASAAVSTSDPI
jgi:hypothetical protein